MPKVWNKHHKNAPLDAVYVGRPSKWGNPFTIGTHGDRESCIMQYEQLIQPMWKEIRRDLKGKDLVCWCAPKACHADVLLTIANMEDD